MITERGIFTVTLLVGQTCEWTASYSEPELQGRQANISPVSLCIYLHDCWDGTALCATGGTTLDTGGVVGKTPRQFIWITMYISFTWNELRLSKWQKSWIIWHIGLLVMFWLFDMLRY